MKQATTFIAAAIFLFAFGKTQGQNITALPANDTANYPYWIQMMQDPGANFFKTQRAFNIYWKDRKVTRSSGWKVFKRWEYMMQSRIHPDGSLPAPDATFKAYEKYIQNNPDAPTSSSGNWISLGPGEIPAPGPPGYLGLGRLNEVAFHPSDPNKLYVGSPSGGMWQTTDGGLTWITHTDTMPTLGVSAIVVDYSNPNTILIGTGDRDAGDAPGMGVFRSTNGGLTWSPSSSGMNNRTVGKMLQHPSNPLIFLAATSGGVFRSTDGGNTWTNSKTGDFKDIQFKPNNPNIVYASAGPTFYRSSDNGVSFTMITSGLSGGQRGTIAVTPANPDYVYFVQSNGSNGFKGLYRSTDAGLTFTTRSTTPNILDWSCDGSGSGGQGWYDLAIAASPNNAETIFVGGVDVWKSTDGGATWNINSHWYGGCSVAEVHADCHILVFSPVNGKLYAGNDGGIWSTANVGTTWSDHTVGMTIGQIYKIGQAQTVKNKVINGFQDNGSYTFTGDGWEATGGGDGMECAIDYSNASWTYHTMYYGSVFRKYNGSEETQIAGNGVGGIDESGAWVTPFILNVTDPKSMFLGMKNIWRCSNVRVSSPEWVKISNSLGGSNGSNMAVLEQSPADPNILYAARYDNKFFRSENCLENIPEWIDISSHLPISGLITDLAAHPTDPGTIYMTSGTLIFKSTDKGNTWTNITENLPQIHISTVAYYNNAPEGLYVGTDAGVFYKDQTTSGWIAYSDGLPANGRITEVEIYYDNDSAASDAIRASSYGRGLWSSDMYHGVPDIDFIANKTLIPDSCSINFTDLSTGVPTFWQWTFEGGLPSSSSLKNPVNIKYNAPGTFLVKLKAWNDLGSDSITKSGYITVDDQLMPNVGFYADKTTACTGEVIHLVDTTENCPTRWQWAFVPDNVLFVEGTDASSQNPAVQFTQKGNYSVKLTLHNGNGCSILEKTDYIMYGGYPVPFEESFNAGFSGTNWVISNPDQFITWDTITVIGSTPGTKSAWMNFYNYNTINKRDQLISPPLDFSNMVSANLSFRHAYAQRSSLKDSLIIKVSADCGASWVRIFAEGPDQTPEAFVTHEPMMQAFFPQSNSDWCSGSYGVACYSLDVTPLAGREGVKIMFESYNRSGNNLFINDIQISGVVGNEVKKYPASTINIYPNPSPGIFTVSIKGLQTATLTLFNIQGQRIYMQPVESVDGSIEKRVDLSGFSQGIYYIQVSTEQTSEIKKIIIE